MSQLCGVILFYSFFFFPFFWLFWTGREDTVGAMAFCLKPRPCTWDLAVDYNAAKQFQVDVTLDPTTAGPEVILSEDLKEATWGRPGRRWPAGPGRFDTDPCMLGSQGFTSGRHYWEVEASGRFWTVGVARESVRRKGRILFKPNAEIWGLQKYDELCVALTAPSNTSVPLHGGEIGVYLDYEVGQVSFYALGTRRRVFTFRVASFSGERVFPYFCVLLSTIKLPPRG
nr:E3 ubiquitin-protein ligase TRIM7 isoform X1 [Anser cygnoides]